MARFLRPSWRTCNYWILLDVASYHADFLAQDVLSRTVSDAESCDMLGYVVSTSIQVAGDFNDAT